MHNATGEYKAGLKKDDSTVDHIFTLLSITQMHFAKKCRLYHKLHLLILKKSICLKSIKKLPTERTTQDGRLSQPSEVPAMPR